jgi:hypothetical protein
MVENVIGVNAYSGEMERVSWLGIASSSSAASSWVMVQVLFDFELLCLPAKLTSRFLLPISSRQIDRHCRFLPAKSRRVST